MNLPIQTVHLFPKLDAKLFELLRSLEPSDWNRYTLAKAWTVKNVASHLLDGNIRSLSILRDNYVGENPGKIEGYSDLVAFLNKLNADWVVATKRMSPSVLIELLEITGKGFCEQMARLDPFDDAVFSVAWAGQQASPNWFHIAREYTEKWHHQQQIREAVNKSGIMTREFFFPVIDTFMQALPFTYSSIKAKQGTTVKVIVTSETGGEWIIVRNENEWNFVNEYNGAPDALVRINPDVAWKLLTNAISETEAASQIQFEIDDALGKPILKMRSVMV